MHSTKTGTAQNTLAGAAAGYLEPGAGAIAPWSPRAASLFLTLASLAGWGVLALVVVNLS